MKLRRHDILEAHVGKPEFVTDICDMMLEDFRRTMEMASMKALKKITSIAEAIEGDLVNFQGTRDEMPLFKLHPEFGAMAELVLEEVKQRSFQMRKLRAPARKRAVEWYGAEIML